MVSDIVTWDDICCLIIDNIGAMGATPATIRSGASTPLTVGQGEENILSGSRAGGGESM